MNNRRVVVTGVGAITALGLDIDSTWRGVTNGVNGVRPIDHLTRQLSLLVLVRVSMIFRLTVT